jgi:hypothetical protein
MEGSGRMEGHGGIGLTHEATTDWLPKEIECCYLLRAGRPAAPQVTESRGSRSAISRCARYPSRSRFGTTMADRRK